MKCQSKLKPPIIIGEAIGDGVVHQFGGMSDKEYNRRYAEHCAEAGNWVNGVTSTVANVFNWRNLEENTILGPFAYCWNHFDEYTDSNATYEDLVSYSENIFNAAATLSIAKAGCTALKGKTGKLTRVESVAGGVVKAEEIAGKEKILDKVDDISKSGTDTNLLDDISKFTDDKLENNYQAYVNRKIKKGQTPKDRLEWKEASDYWTKELPVARGNNFNRTVREADIYDYHEVYLENGKRLDS